MGGVVGEPFGAEGWRGWGVARGGRRGFAFHSVKSGSFAFFSHVGPSFPAFNPTAALGGMGNGPPVGRGSAKRRPSYPLAAIAS